MLNQLCAILGFIIVFAAGLAFGESPITDICKDEKTGIFFGYIQDDKFKFKPGFDTYPRNVKCIPIVLEPDSLAFRQFFAIQVVEL